ncbi:MAG: cytochrome c3 family protein, partial [Deltaproteobacteria bacterium]|nr:cytochrome c3 family protein [Deltaproteobacteria bacterium]
MRFDKKNRKNLLSTLAIIAVILCGTYLFSPNADATGGAFKNTKHGGGTVDNIKFPGVNRGINPALFGVYSSDPEAGVYQAGECNHCHEPHASFGSNGGSDGEPEPSGSGPDDYLLFSDITATNSNPLCWYCHEYMALGFPPKPFGYGYYGFYQGQAVFESSSHGDPGTTAFKWPGDADLYNGTSGNVWPRNYDRNTAGVDTNGCINCHTPHGVGNDFDTGLAPATGNYSVDGTADSTLIPRQLIAREEALCLNCHDALVGGPATTNIKASVDYELLGSDGSGHPVRSIYGVHDLDKESGSSRAANWLVTVGYHAECTDCHNPHVAKSGTVFQESGVATFTSGRTVDAAGVKAGGVNKGVWGVSVTTSTGEITGAVDDTSLPGDTVSSLYLYQICLKCHSAWAWTAGYTSLNIGDNSTRNSPSTTKTFTGSPMPSNYPLTDVAAEFATTGTNTS